MIAMTSLLTLPQRHRRWSSAAAENDKDLLTAIEDQEKGKQVRTSALKTLRCQQSQPADFLAVLKLQEQRQSQKGFGAPQKPRKKAQGSQTRPFQVEYPQAQAAQTPGQQLEANVVRLLAFIFVLFFVEGIFLAVAVSCRLGFLCR